VVAEHVGHNMVFRDRDGTWQSTIFGNDVCAPFRERPGLLELELGSDGRWRPARAGSTAALSSAG